MESLKLRRLFALFGIEYHPGKDEPFQPSNIDLENSSHSLKSDAI